MFSSAALFLLVCCRESDQALEKTDERGIISIDIDVPEIDTFYELQQEQIFSKDTIWVSGEVPIKRVDQVLRVKDHYIVYGYANNGIYSVDTKSGKAKRIIEKGKGPREIISVSDMVYDSVRNQILVADQYLQKINRYGIDGEFLDIFHMDPSVRYFVKGENDTYICSTNSRYINEDFIGSWKPGNSLERTDFVRECVDAEKFSNYNRFSTYDGDIFVTKSMDKPCNFVYKRRKKESLWEPKYNLELKKFLDEDAENVKMRILRFIKISDEDVYIELVADRYLVKYLYNISGKMGKAFRYFSLKDYALQLVGETNNNNLFLTTYKSRSTLSKDENIFYMQPPPPPDGGGIIYETDHPVIVEVDLTSIEF